MINEDPRLIGREITSHLCLKDSQFITYGANYCCNKFCKLTINTNQIVCVILDLSKPDRIGSEFDT